MLSFISLVKPVEFCHGPYGDTVPYSTRKLPITVNQIELGNRHPSLGLETFISIEKNIYKIFSKFSSNLGLDALDYFNGEQKILQEK